MNVSGAARAQGSSSQSTSGIGPSDGGSLRKAIITTKGGDDSKDPWIVEDGAVSTLVAPPDLLSSWGEYLEGKRLASEVQLWNPEDLYRPPSSVQQQQQQQQQQRQMQHQQQAGGSWEPWANQRSRGGRTRGRGGWRHGRGPGASGTRPYWVNQGYSRAQNNFNFY